MADRPIDAGVAPRRALLAALAVGAIAMPVRRATAIGRHGRIEPPEPVPDTTVIRDDGARTTLAAQLHGRITAVHFMFTACASTCPIQGAVFARVQAELAMRRLARVQLLSISVDPLGDDAASLARWRTRLSAGPQWRAVVPTSAHAPRLLQWATGGQPSGADSHATQVLLLDDRAHLVFRTTDLPDPSDLTRLLAQLDATKPGSDHNFPRPPTRRAGMGV